MKKYRKYILAIIIVLVIIACVHRGQLLLARLDMWGRFGDLENWKGIVLRCWGEPEALGFSVAEERKPDEKDMAFCSNEVVHLAGDMYLVGCYGVTDWGLLINVFCRSDFYCSPEMIEIDSYVGWEYNIACKEAIDNQYVTVCNQFAPSCEYLGYRGVTTLPAPTSIEDGKITLIVSRYDDPNDSREVVINVKTDYLIDQ